MQSDLNLLFLSVKIWSKGEVVEMCGYKEFHQESLVTGKANTEIIHVYISLLKL